MTLMMTDRTAADANSTGIAADIIFYDSDICVLGMVLVASSAQGVCAVLLGDSVGELTADLALRFPKATLIANKVAMANALARVVRYIDAPAQGLDLPLDLRGTPFQRRVWEALQPIAVGTTVTYRELAEMIGSPMASRAVAGACAANPIALAVPCHRVIGSNGDLAGYRWGLSRKRHLIEKESRI